MDRLRRSDPGRPGWTRRGKGRGFSYLDTEGSTITDPETVLRLKGLVIPPAWKQVWICPDPDGHLQAVGTDAAGRRQYLYHPRWRARRDAAKFSHMLEVAAALPICGAGWPVTFPGVGWARLGCWPQRPMCLTPR